MTTSRPPAVSVLIAQHGNTALTDRAVRAVLRSDFAGTVETLVYDNCSPEGPGPVTSRDDVQVVQGSTNLGFGQAINALARKASGDLLFILNNDVVVDPRCLRLLVERMNSLDRPGAVSPQYRNFRGEVLEMGGYLTASARARHLFRRMQPPECFQRLPWRAHYSSAAALLIRRDAFLERDGFDPRYAPAYYEDVDLCLRLWVEGRPTIVEPRALAFHMEGATAGRDLHRGAKAYQLIHRTTFADRWEAVLRDFGPATARTPFSWIMEPQRGAHRILWVSLHLPRPDRDGAGGRILPMLAALRADGHAVALWARHVTDEEHYGKMLEEVGVPWFGRKAARRWPRTDVAQELDHLPTLLEAAPWEAVIVSFAELAATIVPEVRTFAPRAAVLVDDVDLHYLRRRRGHAVGHSTGMSKKNELAAYAGSDGVIVASAVEQQHLRRDLPDLPTTCFVATKPPARVGPAAEGANRVLFLGGFNHSPNVDAVRWWIDVLADRVRDLVGHPVRLRVVGSGFESFTTELDEQERSRVDVRGWVEDLSAEFAHARVFLAPLRYGAGTKSKLLDALTHATPVVTTSIGAEGLAPAAQDAFLVADDADGIAAAVATLLTDDEVWQRQHKALVGAAQAVREAQDAQAAELARWVRGRISAYAAFGSSARGGEEGDDVPDS